METTVLSFYDAIAAGHEPRDYTYMREEIPLGDYAVRLDFMIWSKKQAGINCYCTIPESALKIVLPVYRNEAEEYLAGELDVRTSTFGCRLQVAVEPRGKRGVILRSAVVITNG